MAVGPRSGRLLAPSAASKAERSMSLLTHGCSALLSVAELPTRTRDGTDPYPSVPNDERPIGLTPDAGSRRPRPGSAPPTPY